MVNTSSCDKPEEAVMKSAAEGIPIRPGYCFVCEELTERPRNMSAQKQSREEGFLNKAKNRHRPEWLAQKPLSRAESQPEQ